MLTMSVELWPFGDKTATKRLVTINLANIGRSDDHSGHDYIYTIDEPTPLFGNSISAEGVVRGYDREASCVEMISAILKDYEKPIGVMTESDKVIAQRLRAKTIGVEPQNRWPY